MKHSGTRIALAGSGAILIGLASWMMAAPVVFLATSEVIVEHDAGLISEVTAPSGLLLMTGSFMILSAIRLRLVSFGLAAGAIVYGSFGFSRFASSYLHGTPSETLVVVMYFELAIAALLLALSVRVQSAEPSLSLADLRQEVSQ